MTCIKCHAQMLAPRLMDLDGEFKGETVSVQMTAAECPNCGHKSIEGRHMSEFMQKVADAFRAKRGFLTSTEIRDARERFGMSQIKFAEYLGVGSASVKRWELGELQTKLVDELIRFKTDPAFAEAAIVAYYDRLKVRMEQASLGRASRATHADSSTNCESLAA